MEIFIKNVGEQKKDKKLTRYERILRKDKC